MLKRLPQFDYTGHHNIKITGSKSESNRLLILKALYPNIAISNLSNSQDTLVLQNALNSTDPLKDIHHAGTAMRFLTAYYACFTDKVITLTGSKRMQERPIKILVEALNKLGCNVSYLKNEGFPPLVINPPASLKSFIQLPANISSQYISALMLIVSSRIV
jgi:3-phosphoshikimate 1-carboxyvinyltransferase